MAHDILIVDDEADIRMLTAGILEDEGYETREAADSDAALQAVAHRQPRLVLLDIWLQGSALDGIEILARLKEDHPEVPVVMMSGHGTIETAVSALRLGAYDFVEKPFKADHMLAVIERACEAARLRAENAELRLKAGGTSELIGNCHAIVQLRQAIERVAPTNSRVLISGPAGSGKEVVARLLHARSRRADGPFVVMNCASMEPDRVEEELFGREGGTNGGGNGEAPVRKVGMFERAHGGTLFLDEVADMPLETQGKIVRALQEQTFTRVGGSASVEVDVRVIAATVRDLPQEMAEGRFREDLFYRLAVVPLQVPGLTTRREDIPELAGFFLARFAEAMGQPTRRFGEDALAAMQSYGWPGNVRELRNVVERSLIMAPEDTSAPIGLHVLPAEVTSESPASLRMDRSGEIMSLPLRDAREVFEREYLTAQITRFGGNVSRTAAFIGMERSALHRKLKSLGIHSEEKSRA